MQQDNAAAEQQTRALFAEIDRDIFSKKSVPFVLFCFVLVLLFAFLGEVTKADIHLSPAIAAKMEAKAKEKGVSLSAVVQKACEAY